MKYWAYVNNEILGPYEVEEVKALPAYSPDLLVCPQTPVGEKTEEWREVSKCPDFAGSVAINTPLMSEQIPDQIETGTLQIDHNFNMSNSGRLHSDRIGQLSPLENIGMAAAINSNIQTNQLTRSGRVKAQDINWNLAAAEQEAAQAAAIEAQKKQEEEQSKAEAMVSLPDPIPEPQLQEQPAGSDPFGDIYKDIGGQQASAQETPQAAGLEPLPQLNTQKNTAQSAPSEMPMQNTMEFSLDNNTGDFNMPLGTPENDAPATQNFDFNENAEMRMPSVSAAPAQKADNENCNTKIDDLERKLDRISQNAITKEDFTMSVDPIKMKLDQFDDMFSSIKNSQNQQQADLMSKLNSLEQALSSLAANAGGAAAANPFQSNTYESVSLTPQEPMQGYEDGASTATLVPADPAEAIKKEEKGKKKEPKKKEEIRDTGKKAASTNIIVRFFKGLFKFIFFIILLAVIIYGAAIGLKKFGVYDVAPQIIPLVEKYAPQYKGVIIPMVIEQSDWDGTNAKPSGDDTTATTEETNITENGENDGNTATKDTAETNPTEEEQPAQEKPVQIVSAATAADVMDRFLGYRSASEPSMGEKLDAIKYGRQFDTPVNQSKDGNGIFDVDVIFRGNNAKTYSFVYNDTSKILSGKNPESQAIVDAQSLQEIEKIIPAPTAEPAPATRKGRGKGRKAARASAAAKPAEKPAETKPANPTPAPQDDGEFEVSLGDDD